MMVTTGFSGNRTAMGEYIVQPGEKPLTSLGDPLPGPADYNPSLNLTKYSAAQHSIVGRQKTKDHGKGLPGPSDYRTSGNLIWKKQFALKGRGTCYFDEEAAAKATPSPAAYYPTQFSKCKNSTTLAYRWFDVEEPVRPGPGSYSTATTHMKKDPAYTVRQRTKPSYPESLHYVSKGVEDIPGPGSYQVSRDILENDSPAYSMKQQLKSSEQDTPAPNKYPYEKKTATSGSKFSMGKRFELPDSRKNNPGPGTYSPKLLKSAPKFSMKGRTDIQGKNVRTPAPNAYAIPPSIKMNQTKSGVAFKSRPSPYVYSGFRTSKLMDGNTEVAVNA